MHNTLHRRVRIPAIVNMLKLAISNVVISKKRKSRFLKHNHVIVVLQDIVCKLEVVKKLGKKQERPQVCHFEFVPSGNGTSVVENTLPFGTWKFRKCQPEILVEWKAPNIFFIWTAVHHGGHALERAFGKGLFNRSY